jgi:hypothetical protein
MLKWKQFFFFFFFFFFLHIDLWTENIIVIIKNQLQQCKCNIIFSLANKYTGFYINVESNV